MEQKVHKFLDFFNSNLNSLKQSDSSDSSVLVKTEAQIGFRINYVEKTEELNVKVIGAKQLPSNYGSVKPKGYVVKVTLFPTKEKFETKTVHDSWPTINQEFSFQLHLPTSGGYASSKSLKGVFLSFTIYATMEEHDEDKNKKSSNITRSKGIMKRFWSFDENSDFLRNNVRRSFSRRSCRNSLTDRRTIGAVTYNLDRKNFTQNLKNDVISTPDLWRSIKEITSGIQSQPREGKKGCIELTLEYSTSEDGTNDVLEVTVTKFRCNLQTMQEHEKVGGQLYIKIQAFESSDVIQKKKSDRFDPTISLKLEANSATLRATVNQFMLNHVKIVIRLMSRNIVGKKALLGIIEIDRNQDFWKEIVASPGIPITKMVNFS